MAKILGIDLGTNSLGWTLIDSQHNEIIKAGVRIFPEGVNKDAKSSESPKNMERRVARGIRKNNFRFKLRRNRLIKELKVLGMMPDETFFTKEKKRNYTEEGKKIKYYHSLEIYGLRKKALNEKLTLHEFGRICLHLNNHRGFKSNAKEKAEIAFSENENKAKAQGIVADSATRLQKKIDEAKAKGEITYGTLGEYFYSLLIANKQSHNINEAISKIRNNDEGEGHYTLREMFESEFDLIWKKQEEFHKNDLKINALFTNANKKKLKDDCIFYQRDLRSSKHLIGKCPWEFTSYKKKITEKDKEGNIVQKIISEKSYLPCSNKSGLIYQEYRIWDVLTNLRYKTDEITDEPLTLVQKQILADILEYKDVLYLNKPNNRFKLDKEKRKEIEEITIQIRNDLGLPKDSNFNIDRINGNRTVSRIVNAIGKEFWESLNSPNRNKTFNWIDKSTGEIKELNSSIEYSTAQQTIWHTIYFSSNFANSQEWLLRKQNRKNNSLDKTYKSLGLTLLQIEKLSGVVLEPDYTSYSNKALNKLLPFLKTNYELHQAEMYLYKKLNSDIRVNDEMLLHSIPIIPNNYLKNPIVQQGANETIRLINAIIEDEELGRPDEIRIELTRDLKKPKDLRETQKRRNDEKDSERENYSKFLTKSLNQYISKSDDRIEKFELYLQLAWSKESFETIKGEISLKEFQDFANNMDDVKIKDYKRKYDLWLECGRWLPYTNEIISLSELFSNDIEIEHIIPYSRCYDNSFANKTLSTKSFNTKKGNLTPLEYFEGKSKKELDEFKKRIKDLPESKKKRFLMKSDEIDTFKNSQLTNTAYVTSLISEHLRKSFKADQIKITNGAITSIMRNILGLNTLLNPPIKVQGYENGRYWVVFDEDGNLFTLFSKISDEQPEVQAGHSVITGYVNNEYLKIGKTRNDHRHHTVDAIAIAFTNNRIIQFLSTITQGYYLKDGIRIKEYTDEAIFIKAFDTNGKFTNEVWNAIMEEAKQQYNIRHIRHDARDAIKEILVSHKSTDKLTSSGKKKIYTSSGKRMKVINKNNEEVAFISGGDVARGQLHEATLYGKIHYNQPKDEDKKDWMQRDGIFVYRVPLKYSSKGFFSKPDQLEKIVDPVIRNLAIDAVKKEGLKKALDDGIFLPNKSKKNDRKELIRKPIKVNHIRIASDSRDLTAIRSFKEEKKDYKKAYVETGENYCIAIYGDYECTNRDFENVTFLNAAKRVSLNKKNITPLPFYSLTKKGLLFLMTLSKGDLVIVYNEHPDEIDITNDNQELLFKRLFKVIKSDKNGIIVLGRHNLGNIKADKDKSVKDLKSAEGTVIRCKYSTIKAIKVHISPLGKITKPIK